MHCKENATLNHQYDNYLCTQNEVLKLEMISNSKIVVETAVSESLTICL